MILPYLVEPLSRQHDRESFDCEEESLNDFLKRFAKQNDEKHLSRTFVAVFPSKPKIFGYYSLSSASVEFENVPEDARRKLPRYPVPVAHLGRLAVDKTAKRQGLGEFLLLDALRRTLLVAEDLGIFAVEVVALNARAKEFYLKYNFVELTDDEQHLYLPIKTIGKLGLT